jgi:hypothetical protein
MDRLIKQARSSRLSLILTMQNLSDARTADWDATDALVGNTAVKIVCAARDDVGRKRLMSIGGEKVVERESHSVTESESSSGRSTAISVTKTQTVVPRIGPAEIEQLNADPELVIVEASPDSGFTRLANGWALLRVPFAVPTELFEEIRKTPPPEADGVTTFYARDITPAVVAPKGKNPDEDEEGGASAVIAPKPKPSPPTKKAEKPPEPEDLVAKALSGS